MSANTLVVARYRCIQCLWGAVPVPIRPRSAEESFKDYAYKVAAACLDDHQRRAPHCPNERLDVYVPQSELDDAS